MNLGKAFGDFVRGINNVHVGSIGLGTALVSAATIIAGPKLQGTVNAHTVGFTQYAATQFISMAVTGAQATLAPSIFAAWAGMPKPVATASSGPGSPQNAPPGGNVIAFPTKRDSNAA